MTSETSLPVGVTLLHRGNVRQVFWSLWAPLRHTLGWQESSLAVLEFPCEQSFFLQVKIYMKVDLHMVGCRQFAGVRRLA